MGENRVKFPLLICTADKSSTAQPPTTFSTARAHVGPSSACLQKAEVVLLSPAPLTLPSWKKSYLRPVARDESSALARVQGLELVRHLQGLLLAMEAACPFSCPSLLCPTTEEEQPVAGGWLQILS